MRAQNVVNRHDQHGGYIRVSQDLTLWQTLSGELEFAVLVNQPCREPPNSLVIAISVLRELLLEEHFPHDFLSTEAVSSSSSQRS